MGMEKLYHLDMQYIRDPKFFGPIKLFQIGRMYCKPTTVVDSHFHIDWFELTIITAGSGSVYTNGVKCPVKRGDIYLSYPCDVHKIESDAKDPLKYDFFSFSVLDKALATEFGKIVQTHYPPDARTFQDERIQTLIQNAIREFDSEKFGRHSLLDAIFTQVLVYLVRKFQGIPQPDKFDTVKESEAFCYRIMNYVDTHIYSMKNLSEISEVMGYSFGYITALFKKVTSHTLSQYYNERKFETARLLVVEQRLKISEIAELLNYSSVYAFSKAFRKWFGYSPREYVIEYEEKKRQNSPRDEEEEESTASE